MKNNDETANFLGHVYVNFQRSELAYKNYMEDGKKFIHARILKKCNEAIYHLLIEKSHLLPNDLLMDAVYLISHFDIWLEKYNDWEKKKAPGLDDAFIFENKFTFPRQSAQNIENEFLKIRSDV